MDIAGAKALKKAARSERNEPSSACLRRCSRGRPPAFHWLGVGRPAPETPPELADEEPGGSPPRPELPLGRQALFIGAASQSAFLDISP
jgi:hypothetical protein